MNNKPYIFGILSILSAFVAVIIGVSIADYTYTVRQNTCKQEAVYETSIESNLSREDDNMDIMATDATKNDAMAVAATDTIESNSNIVVTSKQDFSELQITFSNLVDKYNSIVDKCKDTDFSNDESISDIFTQTKELINEMGSVDLSESTDSEIQEIKESMEIMSQVLDQLNECVSLSISDESTTSNS